MYFIWAIAILFVLLFLDLRFLPYIKRIIRLTKHYFKIMSTIKTVQSPELKEVLEDCAEHVKQRIKEQKI